MEQHGIGNMSSKKLVLAASIILGTSLLGTAAIPREASADKLNILERGPNHRVVRHVTRHTNDVGLVFARTNNYTELATGLHYQENGVWKETKEEIEILPNGAGAVARQGGHKVIFAPNLNTLGVIDLETPDGQRLRSHVLGLGYYDPASGRSEIIAVVKSSEGELVGDNQVIYRDGFAGVQADVRYTYRKSGFEQDVILRSSPPAPEKFGLNPKTTRLEVFTEFLNPPAPVKTERAVSGTSLRDEKLKFGQMSLGPGRAFPLADGNKSKSSVPTGKTWIYYEGRTILLEEVEYQTVEKHLKRLPGGKKSAQLKAKTTSKLLADGRKIPGALLASGPTPAKPMRLASLSPKEAGFVLDYVAVQEWTEDQDAVFQSGQTYFISAGYWPNSLTIQAGAVVKFADDPDYGGWGLTLSGNAVLHCPTNGMATLTSMHDNTVGADIEYSTGQPDPDVAAIYLELGNGPARIHNLHFKYALAGMITGGSDTDNQIRECQFVDCQSGILGYGAVALTNVSFSDCANLVDYAWLGSSLGTCDVKLAHVQDATGGAVLNLDPEADLAAVTLQLHKCCLPQESEINALGAAITTAGGTFSWTLCDPNDTDGDDLPDAWEVQQFGGLSQRGTDDYDGDGISNYDEYVAESDPNTINFTARFDNLYVPNRTVTGLCEVSNGVPYQMTVLINSTNLATATWSNYQSSFTFTLPDLDGDHDVLVALRGRVTTNAPVQDFTELTLDRVPPVLAITNPIVVSATATVIKPYLQLQGYADETLSTYSYDLTNEFGLVTNRTVCVVDQAFDTNKFDFTTNYFQAFDIPLATNGNSITLSVSDLAGNVTTTNLEVMLDYTLATNAPVLALVWPTNDMQISGDIFYIRGKINDETATLVAQQVDVNDVTNTVTGIVERNGMFWVENLPLTAGNNEWTLIATDAAGNVSSTNLTVGKSTVTVAITSTPTGDALYDPSGSVSGTVSDASYSVTVNGAAAAVESSANGDGTYNWMAEHVPNYGQGTVTYDVTATPSGGGGGNSPVQASAQKELGPIVKITEHHVSLATSSWFGSTDYTKNYTANYTPSATGEWQAKYNGNSTETSIDDTEGIYGYFTSEATWSDTDPVGTVTGWSSAWGDYGPAPISGGEGQSIPHRSFDNNAGGSPAYVYHYYAKGVQHAWPNGGGKPYKLTVGAGTTETLYTGGKSGVSRQNLFCLQGGATKYYGKPQQFEWVYTPATNLPGPAIQVAGKTLDANYKAYQIFPDNAPVDVTVRVKGAKHYSAGVDPTKYKSHFYAYVEMPWPGWDTMLAFHPTHLGGHAWYSLECDAPIEAIFAMGCTNTYYLNVPIGFFAAESQYLSAAITEVDGDLRVPGAGSVCHVSLPPRRGEIGFYELLNGLNYSQQLDADPGKYRLWENIGTSHGPARNCTTITVEAGRAVGVRLPDDWYPQALGMHLRPLTNE